MARYEHLNIYKTANELYYQVVMISSDFPRKYKFSIGDKLLTSSLNAMLMVNKINSEFDHQEKIFLLDVMITYTEEVIAIIEVSKRVGFLSIEHYGSLSLLAVSIRKQASGWKKKFQSFI